MPVLYIWLQVRAERDSAACEAALEKIRRCCEGEEGNLLQLSVDAARARATVEEITGAMEKVGKYVSVMVQVGFRHVHILCIPISTRLGFDP